MQENIDEELKWVVQKELAPATIDDLSSEEDAEGYPILHIQADYKVKDTRLDPEKNLGLTHYLRQTLTEAFVGKYPIFYFLTKEEAEAVTAS